MPRAVVRCAAREHEIQSVVHELVDLEPFRGRERLEHPEAPDPLPGVGVEQVGPAAHCLEALCQRVTEIPQLPLDVLELGQALGDGGSGRHGATKLPGSRPC